MELLFWIDALKRASAASVTAVIPYFSYAKGDKKDEPRVSIRAPCLRGRDRGDGRRPRASRWTSTRRRCRASSTCRSTTSTRCRCCATRSSPRALPDVVVVAPDAGFAKRARAFARTAERAVRDRRQGAHRPLRSRRTSSTSSVDVEGKTAVIVDDFTISAGSLADAARIAGRPRRRADLRDGEPRPADRDRGRAAGSEPDRAALHHRHGRDPTGRAAAQGRGRSRSPALFGEAIRRIHRRESISILFE